MKTILAFGDSNTWGLIPGSNPQERFPWGTRWTSILQGLTDDARIIEEGLCGRTTIFDDALRPGRRGLSTLPGLLESKSPVDAAIIMLGTNDCKTWYGANAYTIGRGIELCLDELQKYVDPSKILLISPIFLGRDVWRSDKDPEFGTGSVDVSRKLKDVYSGIASRRGNLFLAASDFVTASNVDDEHMDAEDHKVFAHAVYNALKAAGIV